MARTVTYSFTGTDAAGISTTVTHDVVVESESTGTLFGACPIGNDGDSQTAANVTAKWGARSSARLFFGSTLTIPTIPAGVLLHCSWKPKQPTNAQIDAMLTAMAGHIVTFWHESDNDTFPAPSGQGQFTGETRADRIALWNRLYDRNVALGRPCIVSHVFVGTFWSTSTTDATRDVWMGTAKGDLIGLDYDGVHDLHTSPPPDGITYYANTGSQTSSSNKMTPAGRITNIQRALTTYAHNGWTGYCVPEFGTSRAPWDTNGAGRLKWLQDSNQQFVDSGAVVVEAYDDRAGSPLKDDVLYAGTPEYDYWRSRVALNPIYT